MAIVYGLNKFRHLVLGQKVHVRTDHQPLTGIGLNGRENAVIHRWREQIADINYEVSYRPGSKNVNADFMSRPPIGQDTIFTLEEEDEEEAQGYTFNDESQKKWIQAKQESSEAITIIKQWKEKQQGSPPANEKEAWGEEANQLGKQWKKLKIVNNLLWYKDQEESHNRIVIPWEGRKEVFSWAHSDQTAGHYGLNKTILKIKRNCYWPKMKTDVARWVAECKQCRKHQPQGKQNRPPLLPIISGTPNTVVAIDIGFMDNTTRRGNRYFIMMVDHFSRWTEAWPIARQDADTVAKLFVNNWCARYGIPNRVISDLGTVFTGKVFTRVCDILGIKKSHSLAWHPQSDGKCEKQVGILKKRLRSSGARDWDDAIPLALLAMRTTPNEATKVSPALITFGRELRTPFDEKLDLPYINTGTHEPSQYVEQLQEHIRDIHKQAREDQRKSAHRMKTKYDRISTNIPLEAGSTAWLESPGINLKNHTRSPVKILERINNYNYQVTHKEGGKIETVSRARLIPYVDDQDNTDSEESIISDKETNQSTESSSEEEEEDDHQFDNIQREDLAPSEEEEQGDTQQQDRQRNQQQSPDHHVQHEERRLPIQEEHPDNQNNIVQNKQYPKRQNRRPPQRYGFTNSEILTITVNKQTQENEDTDNTRREDSKHADNRDPVKDGNQQRSIELPLQAPHQTDITEGQERQHPSAVQHSITSSAASHSHRGAKLVREGGYVPFPEQGHMIKFDKNKDINKKDQSNSNEKAIKGGEVKGTLTSLEKGGQHPEPGARRSVLSPRIQKENKCSIL